MESPYDWLRAEAGLVGTQQSLFRLGQELEAKGDLRTAATAYDRAYGLDPADAGVESARRNLLDRLSLEELGIKFRYIPAGAFLMGSETGDPDERPVHLVQLDE